MTDAVTKAVVDLVKLGKERIEMINLTFGRILKDLEGLEFYIAGGALRDLFANEKHKDIDIYFTSKEKGLRVMERFLMLKAEVAQSNPYMATLKHKGETYQLIFGRPVEKLEDFKKEFDFTCCCAAIDHKGKFVCHSTFLDDARRKELKLERVTSEYGTLTRVIRFVKRGYSINEEELKQLAILLNQISVEEIILDSYEEGNQIEGKA